MVITENKKSFKQTIEQERARHALKNVYNTAKKFPEGSEGRKIFVSCVENLPAAIINNGLGQAAATLLAQAKGATEVPHRIVYNILEDWLCRDNRFAPYKITGDNINTPLMESIVKSDRFSYVKAQAEALSYLDWLKKFTVAFLKEPDNKN